MFICSYVVPLKKLWSWRTKDEERRGMQIGIFKVENYFHIQ